MHFLNGFLAGFIMGVSCCIVQTDPRTDDMTPEQLLSQQNGGYLGTIVGFSIPVTLFLVFVI